MVTVEDSVLRNMTGTLEPFRNTSAGTVDAYAHYVSAVKRMELIGIPIIVVVGLIGNTLSAVTFLSQQLRLLSCSLYLAARAITDCGFLVCLFVVWLQYVGVAVIHNPGVCQVEIFMSYLCGFLSVWFIVWVTLENYYRVCQPFKAPSFCTVRRASLMTVLTTAAGSLLYSSSLWTNGMVTRGQEVVCFMLKEYRTLSSVLTYGDCLVTLVLPCVIILVITARILASILGAHRKRPERMSRCRLRLTTTVSKLLLWVSLVFLLLNLPSHSVRLRVLFEMLTKQTTTASPLLFLAQRILQMVFYLSFSINFFIYISLGPCFRNNFLSIFCRSCRGSGVPGNSPIEMTVEGSNIVNGNASFFLLHRKADNAGVS